MKKRLFLAAVFVALPLGTILTVAQTRVTAQQAPSRPAAAASRIRCKVSLFRSRSSSNRPKLARSAGTGFLAIQPPQANW